MLAGRYYYGRWLSLLSPRVYDACGAFAADNAKVHTPPGECSRSGVRWGGVWGWSLCLCGLRQPQLK